MLELADVSKTFGGVRALAGARLAISAPGRVHALLGENGSGKSTLLAVMSGQLVPDSGEVRVDGEQMAFRAPLDALRRGIAMVSQETSVCPSLTVAENVLLGRLVRTRTGVDWRATHDRAAEVLHALGLDYDTRWRVGDLRPDQRQLVEIARAISFDARLLILDEPTSSLTDDEVEGLFAAMAQLTSRQVSIVFVSHRIPEVLQVSDEVTVLRDGRTVAEGPIARFDADALVAAMVGAETGAARPASLRSRTTSETPRLAATGLCVGPHVNDVEIELAPGELVGVAGLVGAGRSELLEALFGLRPWTGGSVTFDGRPYRPTSPREAIARGVGLVTGDRRGSGLVLGMSVRDNLTMVDAADRFRLAAPDRAREREVYARGASSMRLKTASPQTPVGSLSGGNQQKVVLAKWLAVAPRLLMLDEPTRGVDVAAKAEIHQRLREAAADGVTMLISSSEGPELLELCERIIVMFRGRVAACLARQDASEAALARFAGGHQ